jgi:surface antigen
MGRWTPLLAVGVVMIPLCSACATAGRQQTGAVLGAGAGALAGTAISHGHAGGAIIGGILGALLGSEMGRQMDAIDELKLSRSLESTPSYQPVNWVNPDTGGAYTVTPTRTYTRESGLPCREFRMIGNVGSQSQELVGTACRQGDGSWKIVDYQPATAGY